MDPLQKDFRPHNSRENMMKKPVDFASDQDVNSPLDNGERRHFDHHRDKARAFSLSNATTSIEDVKDTSLDQYIPCFVKKIKGMKPLIEMKPATTFRRFKSNISDCYDKQYSLNKNEGTPCNISDPYSTSAAHDFGSSSCCTSWSLDTQKKASQSPLSSNQSVCSPYPGNRATRSNMNSCISAHDYHGDDNFMRSTPTTYQANRNYRNTHQPGRDSDKLTRGPRIGRGKGAHQDDYNRKDFAVSYSKAKFFMIKSYSENEIYNSMKYSVWSRTICGNQKLDLVYRDAQKIQEAEGTKCPIFLFFSVNSSRQFVGFAEMLGPVDFKKDMNFWLQDRWSGFFPLKWHIVKDIPNYNFRDIKVENNENKVVTFSRDTQEIGLPQGLKMLHTFKEYEPETSLLDDFVYYEEKQREILAKKNSVMQCSDDYLVEEFGSLRFSSEGTS